MCVCVTVCVCVCVCVGECVCVCVYYWWVSVEGLHELTLQVGPGNIPLNNLSVHL